MSEKEITRSPVVDAIGECLTRGGVLDQLVKRGKDPDPGATYIYNHFHAWRSDLPFMDSRVTVERFRRVHKVSRGERGVGYAFEFVDEPGVPYRTNYGWAFVLDTPENKETLETHLQLRRAIEGIERVMADAICKISLK